MQTTFLPDLLAHNVADDVQMTLQMASAVRVPSAHVRR